MMICHIIDELPLPPTGKTGWPWTEAPDLKEHEVKLDNLPVIGIVTPSFNSDQYLEETIRSVLLQGYPNLQYYIVDAGSTDNTIDVIRKYEFWLSGWVSESDKGQSDAINKGWGRVAGDWLGWMNSDDTYLPGGLWLLAKEIIECADSGIVAGSAVWTDASGKAIRYQTLSGFDYIDFLLHLSNHPPSGSTLIRRSVVDAVGGLDLSMNTICDTEYWIRAGLHAKVHTDSQAISTFRYHPGSKTMKLEQMKGPELIQAYNKLFARRDLPPTVLRIRRRAFSFCYLEAARYAARAGDVKSCWKYLHSGIQAGWPYIEVGYLSVVIQSIIGRRATQVIRSILHPLGT